MVLWKLGVKGIQIPVLVKVQSKSCFLISLKKKKPHRIGVKIIRGIWYLQWREMVELHRSRWLSGVRGTCTDNLLGVSKTEIKTCNKSETVSTMKKIVCLFSLTTEIWVLIENISKKCLCVKCFEGSCLHFHFECFKSSFQGCWEFDNCIIFSCNYERLLSEKLTFIFEAQSWEDTGKPGLTLNISVHPFTVCSDGVILVT